MPRPIYSDELEIEVIFNYTKDGRSVVLAKAEYENATIYALSHAFNRTKYMVITQAFLALSSESEGTYELVNVIVEYVPKDEEAVSLGDVLVTNVTLTLSDMYETLARALSKFAAEEYGSSENATLRALGRAYHRTASEPSALAALVRNKMGNYDLPANNTIAIALDDWWTCTLCQFACGLICEGSCYIACLAWSPICWICFTEWYEILAKLGCPAFCYLVCYEWLKACP